MIQLYRPCWPHHSGERRASQHGYLSAEAAARAVPVLNKARHRRGLPQIDSIATFEGTQFVELRPLLEPNAC